MGRIRTAINTRFDMYDAPGFKNEEGNPKYRPALNVVKGHTHTGNPCNSAPDALDPPIAMGYPKDKCFVEGNCAGGRFGSGGWTDAADADGDGFVDIHDMPDPILDTSDRGDAYWGMNHGLDDNPLDGNPNMTRFEMYRYEVEHIIPDNSPAGENADTSHEPVCYTGSTFSDPTLNEDPDHSLAIDRRKFTLAVINCRQVEFDRGKKLAGNATDVPVVGFVDLFLTNPAEGKGLDKADIFAEIIGVAPPGVNGLKDIVQLYR